MAAAMEAASPSESKSPRPVSTRVARSAGRRISRVPQPARTTSAGEGRMKPGSPLRAATKAQPATTTDSKAAGGTDFAAKVLRRREPAGCGRDVSDMSSGLPSVPVDFGGDRRTKPAVTGLDHPAAFREGICGVPRGPGDGLLCTALHARQMCCAGHLHQSIEGALHNPAAFLERTCGRPRGNGFHGVNLVLDPAVADDVDRLLDRRGRS